MNESRPPRQRPLVAASEARPTWLHRWLDYARDLLHDTEHIRACNQLLGDDAVDRADAADLRWPGYVGTGYRPGGLLLVATVHREFASGSPPLPHEQRDRLITATRAWREGTISDTAWLHHLREVYRAGLDRHWIVGRLIRNLQRSIGISVDDISYVNAARCQIVENPPPQNAPEAKQGVVHLCGSRFPIAALAEHLEPGALIMSKGTYDAAAGLLPRHVPVLAVDQRQLCLRAPLRGRDIVLPPKTLIGEWAPVLRTLLEGQPRHG